MRLVIDGKPAPELTRKIEQTFLLAQAQEAVKGSVMTPAEATEYFIRMTKRWFQILAGIAIVLMIGIIVAGLSYEPRDAPILIPCMLLIAGGLCFFLQWLLRRRIRIWNEKLGHRGEGLPPANTVVAIDAGGLTIGAETFPWPSLSVSEMELTHYNASAGDTTSTVHLIERLALASGTRSFVIDRQMLQNGVRLIDNVWRRVRPKPA